jgi:hypothetical protein
MGGCPLALQHFAAHPGDLELGLDTRNELASGERLDHVVVGT